MDARTALESHALAASRARRRRRAAAAASATVALLGATLAVGLLLLLVTPAARPWVVLALASVAVTGAGLTAGALLHGESAARAAAWIARRDPAFGGALADALEFGRDAERGIAPGAGSPDLARAHAARAAELARDRRPADHARAAVPRLLGRFAVVGAAAGLVALAALPGSRRILARGLPDVAVDGVRYGPVELTLRHPAYLGMPDRTDVGTGDVEAPRGTHVTVAVTADRELRSARLESDDGGATAMEVEGPIARGQLVLMRDGAYRILLVGLDGSTDPDPPRHLLTAVPDELPEVRLRAPEGDVVELLPGDALELAFQVSDDHGIAEVVAVVAADSGGEPPEVAPGSGAVPGIERVAVEACSPPCRSRSGARSFTADRLGVAPGASAWIWLEARDDDQVSGPKWAASRRVRVDLSSRDEARELASAEQEEAGERLLEALAGHLVAPPSALPDEIALVRAHGELEAKVSEASETLGRVLEGVRREGADPAAASALQQMRSRLEAMMRLRERRMASARGSADELRAALAPLHPAEVEELERDVLFFDMWADRRAAIEAADTAADLAEALARLEALLARADVPEEAVEQALDEAGALASALEGTLEEVARAAGASPDEAQQAAAALRELLAEVERHLAAGNRGSAEAAAGEAASAAARLGGLVDELSARSAMGDPELAEQVMAARREIRALQRRQADLRDRTNVLRDDARERMGEDDRARADELFRELLELADAAVAEEARGEEELGAVPEVARWFESLEERDRVAERLSELGSSAVRGGLPPDQRAEGVRLRERFNELLAMEPPDFDVEGAMRSAEVARESLGRLRQVIADREIALARMPARWAHGTLEVLLGQVGEADEGIAATAGAFRDAQARVAEILTRLDELQSLADRAAQETLTAGERQQLQDMGAEQAALLAQARALAARLRELGADAPFLGQEVARGLEDAAGHMDAASQRLHGTRPGPASEEQGEAASRLEQAERALSPRPQSGPRRPGSPTGPGRRGRDGRFGGFDRDEVEIPDADAYRVPREFREEILEAMRESEAPVGYEEAVREYYRSLVE